MRIFRMCIIGIGIEGDRESPVLATGYIWLPQRASNCGFSIKKAASLKRLFFTWRCLLILLLSRLYRRR